MTAQACWRALGTGVHLLVTGGEVDVARASVESTLALVDATYSRFRPDSELSLLNARQGEAARVSPLLARAVGSALRAAAATDGLVDPTVGRAVRAAGYDADLATVRSAGGARGASAPADLAAPSGAGASTGAGAPSGPVVRLERIAGWRAVRMDATAATITLPRGVELDLGSTGKALAAELGATAAAASLPAGAGVLLGLGGDIALAGTVPDGGWRISVGDDSAADPRDLDEVVALAGGAIATSSTTVRRWRRDGAELHHIVDPRTGAPATGPWRTATVVAATCTDANAAATAAIIRGADAPAWLARFGLAARLVAHDGSITRVGDWPVPVDGATRSGRTAA